MIKEINACRICGNMNLESIYNSIIYPWLLIEIITFFILFYITAPYGRHNKKMGLMINGRWGWFIQEIISPLTFALFFIGGDSIKTPEMWVFFILWMGHYFNRSIIFPLRQKNAKDTALVVVFAAISFNIINGFINGYYNHAFEKDKEDFSKRGFVHFRVAKPITNKIDIEGFIQRETNHFIKLENRELVGGGLRINQFERLFLGVGIMHEMEKYNNHFEEQNFIKSTNYINYKKTIFETIDLQNVIYYQFKMENPKDLRIFWDGNMTAHTINGISFHINIHYQFDNNGKSYFEFSNGLGFQL